MPLLEDAGHAVKAIDLPGAGANAKFPASYSNRPLDLAAFRTEPSPNAGVTQDERTKATIAALRAFNNESDTKAVLVGHSLGGVTISHVAEAILDELSAVVYLTAYMLPPGMNANQIIGQELMADALTLPLFLGDPEQVGTIRLDPKSDDPEYRATAKEAF